MAKRDSAPRRYAEAAFEIGLRDDTVDTWRRELDAAAETLESGELEGTLANPAIPLDQRIAAARASTSRSASPSATSCCSSSGAAGSSSCPE